MHAKNKQLVVGHSGKNILTHSGVSLVLRGALLHFAEPGQLDVGGLMEWLSEQGRNAAARVVAKVLTGEDPFLDQAEQAFLDLASTLERQAKKKQKQAIKATLDGLTDDEQVAALRTWGQTI